MFKEPGSLDNQATFESCIEPKHGQGLSRTVFPPLSSLLTAAKESGAENSPAMVSLTAAVEDIFTCPGESSDLVHAIELFMGVWNLRQGHSAM